MCIFSRERLLPRSCNGEATVATVATAVTGIAMTAWIIQACEKSPRSMGICWDNFVENIFDLYVYLHLYCLYIHIHIMFCLFIYLFLFFQLNYLI